MIHRKRGRSRENSPVPQDDNDPAAAAAFTTETANEHHDHHPQKSFLATDYLVRMRRRFSTNSMVAGVLILGILAIVSIISLSNSTTTTSTGRLRQLQVVTLMPVGVMLLVGLIGTTTKSHLVSSNRMVPLTFCGSVVLQQLPVSVAAAVAAMGICVFSFTTLHVKQQQQQKEKDFSNDAKNPIPKARSPPTTPVMIAIAVLVSVLLTENFMVWVVSATFPAGQQLDSQPPPLQDNGHFLVQEYLFSGLDKPQIVQGLRRLWNVQWSLVASMGACFLCTELQAATFRASSTTNRRPRTLYGLASRAVWTLAMARAIRTVSFVLTVLPSPVRNCYVRRFPYPPPPLFSSEWWWVGIQPAAHGGCNDLIVSGHATVTSTLACLVTSTLNHDGVAAAVWTMLCLDFAVEIYEGFHYAVDMWLGMVLVVLLWKSLRPWEERVYGKWSDEEEADDEDDRVMDNEHNNNDNHETNDDSADDKTTATTASSTSSSLAWKPQSVQEGVQYGIPALLAYGQLVLFPSWTANFLIVSYVGVAIGLFWVQLQSAKAQQESSSSFHYIQHVVLCLLFLALGVYL